MEIFKLADNKFVAVENGKATIFDQKEVEAEVVNIEARLIAIPSLPSDDELLKWARDNYPMMDYSKEKSELTSRKEKLEQLIDAVKVK